MRDCGASLLEGGFGYAMNDLYCCDGRSHDDVHRECQYDPESAICAVVSAIDLCVDLILTLTLTLTLSAT